MWIVFENVKRDATEKDLLRLLISIEVPSQVGMHWDESSFVMCAELRRNGKCGMEILNKHPSFAKKRLGSNVHFYASDHAPKQCRLRNVEGRAEA